MQEYCIAAESNLYVRSNRGIVLVVSPRATFWWCLLHCQRYLFIWSCSVGALHGRAANREDLARPENSRWSATKYCRLDHTVLGSGPCQKAYSYWHPCGYSTGYLLRIHLRSASKVAEDKEAHPEQNCSVDFLLLLYRDKYLSHRDLIFFCDYLVSPWVIIERQGIESLHFCLSIWCWLFWWRMASDLSPCLWGFKFFTS